MPIRAAFDQVPELYDSVRPVYPAELVSDLASLTGIGTGSRVLEIGPGTGQLSVQLARLGCDLTAVELGPRLAEVARRNLASFPRAVVVTFDFDTWPLPEEPFDAVVSAASFHWLHPDTRVARVAAALRPCGSLALVDIHHIAGDDAAFFADEEACSARWGGILSGAGAVPEREIPYDDAEFVDSGLFGAAQFRRHIADIEYSSATYQARLLTYAGTLAADPAIRAGLVREIGELINNRYGGRVKKRYMYELRISRLRPRSPAVGEPDVT